MATAEYSLTVPVDLVKKTKGLALDIGGSVVKIVYRSKANLDEAESNTNGVDGHLQLVSFPKYKLTDALEYIRQRSTITRNGTNEHPEVFTTGIGCAFLGKTFSETLNIRINNITEFDCFVKAFVYLASQLPRKDFLEPRDLKVAREAETEMMAEMVVYAKIQENDLTEGFNGLDFKSNDFQQLTRDDHQCSPDTPLAQYEDIYPCILAMCGSGIGYIQINADKSFKVLDISNRGGRALHGMGTLLTGNKSFAEFLEMASRGDPRNVDIYSDELFKDDLPTDVGESVYTVASEIKHPGLVYSFGKGVGARKEQFRPEDLAISWLHYLVLDIVQCFTLVAQVHGIKRLFFCGSTCGSPLVRSMLTKEMTRRIILLSFFDPIKVGGTQFNFLKPGPHLGALGALITELEKNLTGDNATTHL